MLRSDERGMEADRLPVTVFQHLPGNGRIALPVTDLGGLAGGHQLLLQLQDPLQLHVSGLQDPGCRSRALLHESHQDMLGSHSPGTRFLCGLRSQDQGLLCFLCISLHKVPFIPPVR